MWLRSLVNTTEPVCVKVHFPPELFLPYPAISSLPAVASCPLSAVLFKMSPPSAEHQRCSRMRSAVAAKSQPACRHGGQGLQSAPPPSSSQRCFSNRIVSKLLRSAPSAVGEGISAETAAHYSFWKGCNVTDWVCMWNHTQIVGGEKTHFLPSYPPNQLSSKRVYRCWERARLYSSALREQCYKAI